MKRILAITLTLFMLLGMTAIAEEAAGTAAIMTIDNITLETQGQKIALDGLVAHLALDVIDGAPSLVGMVDGSDEPLLTAIAQLRDGKMLATIDGLGYAIGEDIPATAAQQLGQLTEQMPQIIAGLDEAKLPPIPGIPIPKVDMSALLTSFSTGDGTFEIPYTVLSALLSQVSSLGRTIGSSIPNSEAVFGLIDQLVQSGLSVTSRGTIDDDGATQTVSGDIYLVQGDTEGDAPVASLTLASSENNFVITVSVDMGGGAAPVATISLISDPQAAELHLLADVGGMVNLGFDIYSEDGLQKVAMALSGSGEQVDLEFGYGVQEGDDVVTLSGAVNDGTAFGFSTVTAVGSDGVRTGTMSVYATQNGEQYFFAGDLTMYTGADIGLAGYTMPTEIRDPNSVDNEAVNALLQPVADYIGNHAVIDQAA